MHTPGPWIIDEDGRFVYSLNKNGCNRFHAAVSPGHIPGYDSEGIQKANAQLIAAAPELLEVLELGLQIQKDNYGNATDTHLALIDWAKIVSEKISKVKGK